MDTKIKKKTNRTFRGLGRHKLGLWKHFRKFRWVCLVMGFQLFTISIAVIPSDQMSDRES